MFPLGCILDYRQRFIRSGRLHADLERRRTLGQVGELVDEGGGLPKVRIDGYCFRQQFLIDLLYVLGHFPIIIGMLYFSL